MPRSCTASSWPASSSTARCWPTSPCATPRPSADSPRAPARRPRADRADIPFPGAPPPGAAPVFVKGPIQVTITSPHNDQLKEIRKLAGRKWRDKLRQFVAEGEDLLAAVDAAGWEPLARLVAEGSGLDGEEVRPHLLQQISQLGSGTRAIGVYGQRWTEATGPLCLALWGVNDPGNVGTALRSALAFGAASVALGPGTADPYGHKAV